MAEKYGVVPPKFSKEWWPYYWTYYKWHTIAALFIIFSIAFTIQQKLTAPKYDLNVTYTGGVAVSEEIDGKLQEIINSLTDDIDQNGKSAAYFQQLIISNDQRNAEYDLAMRTKLMVEFQNDCSFIFLMDEDMLVPMMMSDAFDGVFLPVSEWADGEVGEDVLYKAEGEDIAYAVNLKNSKILKDASVPCENMYAAICVNNKEGEKNAAAFENSKKIVNALLQQ